jgi:DNA-binding NarL/FixJ family response regulator
MRILIADDHEVVRRGIRAVLEGEPRWQIVGEARNGREAVQEAIRLKPDIVMMDIAMPGLNGIDALGQISKALPRTKILMLTMHESDELVRAALHGGARGYVVKSSVGRDITLALNALAQNKTFFPARVDEMILETFLHGRSSSIHLPATRDMLTARQREILQLLAEGKTSKEVAGILNLSTKTVDTHRANLMKRLGCHSVGELVRYSVRNNIIQP